MISTRKLIKLAKKWQKIAANKRKRISLPTYYGEVSTSGCSSSPTTTEKGHFVVYSTDQKRYSIPIAYLTNHIFRELFKMSEEEYGIPSDGPITLPCDAIFMDYVISLIQRKPTNEIEQALLMSLADYRCSSSSCSVYHQETSRHLVLCSF